MNGVVIQVNVVQVVLLVNADKKVILPKVFTFVMKCLRNRWRDNVR